MPVGDVISLGPRSYSLNRFVPTTADYESPQREHFFRVGFQPECSAPLQSEIDHAPDTTVNRNAIRNFPLPIPDVSVPVLCAAAVIVFCLTTWKARTSLTNLSKIRIGEW